MDHRRNPHTQVPPNPPEILSLPRPIVHGQIDSLGLKQAGWGASGVGGLAMGQGPLSLTVASCHTNYGTLLSPFSMARSPNKPSPPPPMHDPELVVCCTLCLHKGLLAALVVPPPPSPPILLANLPEAQQGNTTNIVMKVRLGARRKVRQSILQCRPPPPLGRISMRGSSGESSRHHLRESTHPRGFPIPCRSQSPPQALGLRRRLFRRRV